MKPTLFFALILLALAGCSRQSASVAGQQPAAKPATTSAAQSGQTASGTVLETVDAASYTYIRVKTAGGEIWAAAPQTKVSVGDRVIVPLEMPVKDFHSPSLKRDFAVLYFVARIEREGEAATAAAASQVAPAPMMPSHGQMTGAPATETLTTKIAPAEGGLSIEDVWTRRASLAGKMVSVRGKVMKFNGGILDRNWIHIQDGSGDPKAGTHDLTITSQGVTKVGDIITATGKLTMNKDIGSGYKYAVILEDATIK